MDADVSIHRLLDKGDDVARRNPGCAETGSDVGGPKIGGLHALERFDIAGKGGIESRSRFSGLQLLSLIHI